jgi:hypothetical protein
MMPAGIIHIPELRFRQYWKQMASIKGLGGGRLPRDPVLADVAFRAREAQRSP